MADPKAEFFAHVESIGEYLRTDFSESDTRVYLVDPVLRMLGYVRPGDLRREVPVPATREFLDYELYADGKALAIVEAKALRHPITDQAAAQCVQYAAVLGVRWCIVTNGATWAIYNAHATGPLPDKKVAVVRLDGDARATAEAWEVLSLFRQSVLLQESPLSRLLAERVIADELNRPDSSAVAALRDAVRRRFAERVSGQTVVEVVQRWREKGRAPEVPFADTSSPASAPTATRPPAAVPEIAGGTGRTERANVSLHDLVAAGLLPEGATIELRVGGELVSGRIDGGVIVVGETTFTSPSQAAVALRGGSVNGWVAWSYQGQSLSALRAQLVEQQRLP